MIMMKVLILTNLIKIQSGCSNLSWVIYSPRRLLFPNNPRGKVFENTVFTNTMKISDVEIYDWTLTGKLNCSSLSELSELQWMHRWYCTVKFEYHKYFQREFIVISYPPFKRKHYITSRHHSPIFQFIIYFSQYRKFTCIYNELK